MRLTEHDSQIAMAGVQLLERDLADRLELDPEVRGYDYRLREDERRALDEHDRITEVVRKLATGGEHELFDWETDIVCEGLVRYRSVLSDSTASLRSIVDENSQFITTEEQRKVEYERASTLLQRLNPRRSS